MKNIKSLVSILFIALIMNSTISMTEAAPQAEGIDGFSDTWTPVPHSDPFRVTSAGGYLYVTDYIYSTVKRISVIDGRETILAGTSGQFGSADGVSGAALLGQPAGIWVGSAAVYFSDAYFDTIRRISLETGDVTTIAGSANSESGSEDGVGAATSFHTPLGIWGDGTYLYVCDSLNFTIRRIAVATGEVTTIAGRAQVRGTEDGIGSEAQFFAPTGIWGDGTYLYVTDGSAVRRVTVSTGEVRTVAGSASESSYADGNGLRAGFSFLGGMWGDGTNLFVADSGNELIRKIELASGMVSTVAGVPSSAGANTGRGSEARFSTPTDVSGDAQALFIVDRSNSRIRRATAPLSETMTNLLTLQVD